MEAATNPALEASISDPTLFCTAYKKNRFYMFTKLVFVLCCILIKISIFLI